MHYRSALNVSDLQGDEVLSQIDALIVVDMQEWILNLPLAPYGGEDLSRRVGSLVELWREANPHKPIIWVAYLRYDGSDGGLEGSARIVIDSRKDEDATIIKYGISAFQETNLHSLLGECGVRGIAIAGVATDYAVGATALDALKCGYQVWVPGDTCSSTSGESQVKTLQKLSSVHVKIDNALIGSLCVGKDEK